MTHRHACAARQRAEVCSSLTSEVASTLLLTTSRTLVATAETQARAPAHECAAPAAARGGHAKKRLASLDPRAFPRVLNEVCGNQSSMTRQRTRPALSQSARNAVVAPRFAKKASRHVKVAPAPNLQGQCKLAATVTAAQGTVDAACAACSRCGLVRAQAWLMHARPQTFWLQASVERGAWSRDGVLLKRASCC